MSCEPQTISPRPAGKAVSTPAQRPTAPQPGPAAPQPTPAAARPALAAQQPPVKRRLNGRIYVGDGLKEGLRGTLASFGAKYKVSTRRLHILLEVEDCGFLSLRVDYVHARAAVTTLRNALDAFACLQARDTTSTVADFQDISQVNCFRSERGYDEELRFAVLPHRDLIRTTATFSDADSNGEDYHVDACLTRTEAEALLHDLERGIADLERYEGVGI